MTKITYEDKEFLNKNESIADKNKVNDTDLNEIKNVVNENDDSVGNLSNLNTEDKSSLVNAVNEILNKSYFTIDTNSNISIGQGDNTINFDNILAQNQIAFTNNSGIFTANKDCIISVNYHLNLNGSSGQVPIIRIWKNNTQLSQSGIQIYGSNNPISVANFIIPLNTGDTFKITLNGNTGNVTVRLKSFISIVEI